MRGFFVDSIDTEFAILLQVVSTALYDHKSSEIIHILQCKRENVSYQGVWGRGGN
jgi:hypothetical protein